MGGNLHTQIAPGHHHAVGHVDDGVQVVHTLPVLNLGDDADILAAALVEVGADVLHVAGLPHEGGGDEVEVLLHGELQILLVLLGEGGQEDVNVGDVDGLVVGEGAAVFHGADDLLAVNLLHQQIDEAVVHQDVVAGGDLLVEVQVGDGDLVGAALTVGGGEGKGVPLLELDAAVLKGLDADLGALGVQNGGHGETQLVPDVAELLELGEVALVGAVGEVEAGGVHAREDELADHVLVVHSGTEGTDNLGLSHIGHR